jgi:hypothetical protein
VHVSQDFGNDLIVVGIFDPKTRRDSLLAAVVQDPGNVVTAFSGSKLYFLNAVHPDFPGANVVSYDFAIGTWGKEPNLEGVARLNSAVAANGKLYALTRVANTVDSVDVHVMDLATQAWTVKKRRASNIETSLAEVDGVVYLSASLNGPFITTWEKYNPEADSWAAMVISQRMRQTVATRLVGVNGSIYSIGGFSTGLEEMNLVERFDSARNEWVSAPELRIGRYRPGVVAIGAGIYVLGGMIDSRLAPIIEEYLPE